MIGMNTHSSCVVPVYLDAIHYVCAIFICDAFTFRYPLNYSMPFRTSFIMLAQFSEFATLYPFWIHGIFRHTTSESISSSPRCAARSSFFPVSAGSKNVFVLARVLGFSNLNSTSGTCYVAIFLSWMSRPFVYLTIAYNIM